MPELTERQRTLLLLIIRHYIESARPVGSKQLVDDYRLHLSPATIRNEMSALTEMGYLRQPHTSAGRVPTEEGYRYFVSQMMNQAELPPSIQATISHQFFQARPGVDQWMTLAASILAHQWSGENFRHFPFQLCLFLTASFIRKFLAPCLSASWWLAPVSPCGFAHTFVALIRLLAARLISLFPCR